MRRLFQNRKNILSILRTKNSENVTPCDEDLFIFYFFNISTAGDSCKMFRKGKKENG